MKRCSRCKQQRPFSAFKVKTNRGRRYLTSACRVCTRAKDRARWHDVLRHQQTEKARRAAYMARYKATRAKRQELRRRARERQGEAYRPIERVEAEARARRAGVGRG